MAIHNKKLIEDNMRNKSNLIRMAKFEFKNEN